MRSHHHTPSRAPRAATDRSIERDAHEEEKVLARRRAHAAREPINHTTPTSRDARDARAHITTPPRRLITDHEHRYSMCGVSLSIDMSEHITTSGER